MAGLMFHPIQKFYSSLKNLERFNTDNNFFDNLSSLDSFFAEFRNITFVMQKSLAHTIYMDTYYELRDKYLSECGWFVEKRNEVTKQNSFQLSKKLELTAYFPNMELPILSTYFTVENDEPLTNITNKIKHFLSTLDPVEVFFSVEFSFYELDKAENIFIKIFDGINIMSVFLHEMYERINESCDLCEKLIKDSQDLLRRFTLIDMFFLDDYVYYPQKDIFDRAQRFAMVLGSDPKIHFPVDAFNKFGVNEFENDYFKEFVLLHVIQQNTELMTVIMTIYNDKTCTLEPFASDLKTTFYRKINETANRVLSENIVAVYMMTVYISVSMEHIDKPSSERRDFAQKEHLAFFKVDKDLNEEEYVFDGDLLKDMKYIANTLKNSGKKELYLGKSNMTPIIEAFRKK